MATRYRRKQCQPRRIVRSNEADGRKCSMSYMVVEQRDSCTKNEDKIQQCIIKRHCENSDPEFNKACEEKLVSDTPIMQEQFSSRLFSSFDANPENLQISSLPYLTSQEAIQSNPLIYFPMAFDNFQNTALSNFAINQAILQSAQLRELSSYQPGFQCMFCDETFAQKSLLEIHIQMHHKGNFSHKDVTDMAPVREQQHQCLECGKSFSHRWNLTQHIKTHGSQVKVFPCLYCPKVFSHDCNRKIHMRAHTGEKPFRCEICGRQFSHKHNMRVHMRTHTREKPYKCPDCPKAFSHVSALKIHSRVHTGEKPYICDICGKPFSHSSTLNVHKRRHTGEKPFQCALCDKTFARDCILKNHLKTHSEAGLKINQELQDALNSSLG